MPPKTHPQLTPAKFARPRFGRSKLDWAIIASIALMLAVNLVALFGDLGPSTVYAAVPM